MVVLGGADPVSSPIATTEGDQGVPVAPPHEWSDAFRPQRVELLAGSEPGIRTLPVSAAPVTAQSKTLVGRPHVRSWGVRLSTSGEVTHLSTGSSRCPLTPQSKTLRIPVGTVTRCRGGSPSRGHTP